MNIIQTIIDFGSAHDVLVYGLIILIAIIEGPIASFTCGMLYRWAILPFWPMYLSLMAGDLIGDIVWYYIGKTTGPRFTEKYGRYFGLTPARVARIEHYFHTYKHQILVLSKLTTGFGFATVVLFTAGMVRIPFRRYITINMLGQFIWTGVLMGFGYLFSHLYSTFNSTFERIFLSAATLTLVVVVIQVGRYLRDTYLMRAE